MTTEIRSSGTWADAAVSSVRDSGTWKDVKAFWVRTSGSVWNHIPPNPPKNLDAHDGSFCDAGTPDYSVDVLWENQHPGMETRIYRDNVLVHTAAAGVTSWTDFGVGLGTYTYEVSHIDSEGLEGPRGPSDNATTVFPC